MTSKYHRYQNILCIHSFEEIFNRFVDVLKFARYYCSMNFQWIYNIWLLRSVIFLLWASMSSDIIYNIVYSIYYIYILLTHFYTTKKSWYVICFPLDGFFDTLSAYSFCLLSFLCVYFLSKQFLVLFSLQTCFYTHFLRFL